MLKFIFWSDLHLEYVNAPIRFVKYLLDNSGIESTDGLVLAGDILPLYRTHEWISLLELISNYTKRVFYCPGNHCFYGNNLESNREILAYLDKSFNSLRVLESHKRFHLKGYKVIGATGWYVEDYQGKSKDFTYIPDSSNWIFQEGEKDANFLSSMEADLVITHHMPSYKCVNAKYKNNPTNVFYVNPWFEKLTYKPKAIIFGHTHSKFYGYQDGTLLINNPLGYPWESNLFDPKCYIKIP
jgi:predicted phosphodiesterase